MTQFFENTIFWVEVEKVKPNPYQPRKEFDEAALRDLSESIRMYGVLQPIVVTRTEIFEEEKGLRVEYELVSGERRLRASKLAGLREIPAIIRTGTDDSRVKLELAIIENLQREDLNVVDRARAFEQLVKQFGLKHGQVAEKVGRSREYVSNTMRVLLLPEDIITALQEAKITEGHTRPLLMLNDRPEEQNTLFKEIMFKKLSVRETERIARRIAYEKVRRPDKMYDPELVELEEKFTESLGTRVHIEKRQIGVGGKIVIDFFSPQDLELILGLIDKNKAPEKSVNIVENAEVGENLDIAETQPIDDSAKTDNSEEDLYSIKNFSL